MSNKFLLAFLLLLGACKQNGQNTPTYMPITDQRLRDAATAKVGSYFIYQDSATGGIDSFGVISFRQTTLYNERDNTANENIGFQSFDSVNGPGMFQTISMSAYRNRIGIGIYIDKINCSGTVVTLPFIINESHFYQNHTTTCIQYYDSYSILGINYSDVYEMKSISKDLGQSTTIHTWFSQQGGLIKFTASDSSRNLTYLLKLSHVIK